MTARYTATFLCFVLILFLLGCDHATRPNPFLNASPVILNDSLQQAVEDSLYVFIPQVIDPDGPVMEIAYPVVPSWLTVTGDSMFGTPGETTPDTCFTLVVFDGWRADTLRAQLSILGVNDPPQITAPDTMFVAAGVHFSFEVVASDPEYLVLAFEFLCLPDWLSISGDVASGVPPDTIDDDSLVLVVSDGELADTAVVQLRFLPPLVVYGDTRTGHDAHRRVVAGIRANHPVAVFHVGDLVNDGDVPADWDVFNEITADMRAEAEFFPAPGNHEEQSPLYFDNFSLPGNEQWYSVERNRVHFIILNTCVDIGPGSAQYQWLLSDLSSIGDSIWFTVAVFHHPPYSTGAHAEDELGLRAILVPVFEQYGVDVAFTGHDHDYERSYCGDVYYIVTGGGGAPLRDQVRQHACSQVFLPVYHFCRLAVLPDRILVRVIDDAGALIDSWEVPPPASPSFIFPD